jgi:hypothetical protein
MRQKMLHHLKQAKPRLADIEEILRKEVERKK